MGGGKNNRKKLCYTYPRAYSIYNFLFVGFSPHPVRSAMETPPHTHRERVSERQRERHTYEHILINYTINVAI